ncbi:MAG: DNA lyase [Deltaproteobacteria bacterium]|nr:DNA lyase [Deltaproteobacteria bacterium]
MRLWSIHPCYLDHKGLVALWREGLLAQKVLSGNTRGYRNHPQLTRFRNTDNPVGAIAVYLRNVADEADRRGYRFDRSRIVKKDFNGKITVTSGQIEYEFRHLTNKLKNRSPGFYEKLKTTEKIEVHPIMQKISGNLESWEIGGIK